MIPAFIYMNNNKKNTSVSSIEDMFDKEDNVKPSGDR